MKAVLVSVLCVVPVMESMAGPSKPLESGPQAGKIIPGPFYSQTVVNFLAPHLNGKRMSYIERYEDGPLVIIFAREPNDSVITLLRAMDASIARSREAAPKNKKPHGLLVMLSDDETMEDKLKDVAKKHQLQITTLTIDHPSGPKAWKIAKEAETTVILCERARVRANHAFRKGNLTEKAVSRVVAEVSKLIGEKN